jgi:hypothetical protein
MKIVCVWLEFFGTTKPALYGATVLSAVFTVTPRLRDFLGMTFAKRNDVSQSFTNSEKKLGLYWRTSGLKYRNSSVGSCGEPIKIGTGVNVSFPLLLKPR